MGRQSLLGAAESASHMRFSTNRPPRVAPARALQNTKLSLTNYSKRVTVRRTTDSTQGNSYRTYRQKIAVRTYGSNQPYSVLSTVRSTPYWARCARYEHRIHS